MDPSDGGCIYISTLCPVPSIVIRTCYLLSVLSALMFVQPADNSETSDATNAALKQRSKTKKKTTTTTQHRFRNHLPLD